MFYSQKTAGQNGNMKDQVLLQVSTEKKNNI